ncbi:hypothetical protein B0H13DRAFT_1554692, partial [Mycena leptocephala]
IHPWINGEAPSPIFHFDLARAECAPSVPIGMERMLDATELREPAFHPPINVLRIYHSRMPFWPIDLARTAPVRADSLLIHPKVARRIELMDDGSATAISLSDILIGLHSAMHTQITQAEWASLDAKDMRAISRAFSKRCRAEAKATGKPPDRTRSEGVKRVDFLLGKTVFKGLVR